MKTTKRALLAIGLFAALLPFGVGSAGAAGITSPAAGGSAGIATDVDRIIDLIVAQRVASKKLSAADVRVAREQLQLQYIAMPAETRAKVLASAQAATSEEGVAGVSRLFNELVANAARQQVDDAAKERLAAVSGDAQRPALTPKLGADGDLVFVATAGPCRVADTRLNVTGAWPGPIAAFTARQIWAFSNAGGYDYNDFQGGTGIAGAGNCAGTVYGGTMPVSVVATVAVVNTFSTGYLRAWNGGTTLTVGGILGWNAGDVLSNTTVIPLNRFISEYPGSGPYKRDFAVYNNSGTQIDVIVDVVGYFIENRATALDCTIVPGPDTNIPASSSVFIDAPACPAGYTAMTAQPTAAWEGLYTGTMWDTACRIGNFSGTARLANCSAFCCRVPGR